MTVQWIDTPGSMLLSKSDVIDFSVTSEPACISVSFGSGRAEERAYRDGAFLSPYLASTREGNVFALRRAGGWPMPPTVYVDESGGTAWDVLYDKDLRTLPTQSIEPVLGRDPWYRTFEADDLLWSLHGSAASLVITQGVGMEMSGRGQGPYSGNIVSLHVYQMPGYDPAKQVAVQVRYSGSMVSGEAGAVLWTGHETWGYGPANNGDLVRLIRTAPGSGVPEVRYLGAASLAPEKAGDVMDNWVFAVAAMPYAADGAGQANRNYRSAYFKRDVTGDMPAIEDMMPAGSFNGVGSGNDGTFKAGFYVGHADWQGTGYVTATHIRVLQRAV
jgi:hypothetical protein